MMQTDMIRDKKLKVTNEITNVMEYYNSSFLQAVPNLMFGIQSAWQKSMD